MTNFYRLTLTLLLWFPVLASAAFDQAEVSSKINDIVEYYHKTEAFQGNIEVRLGDEVLYKKSIGIANEAFQVEHTEQSRFMIASVSKQFTAAAVLKLVEQGLVDLDSPFSKYVPLKRGHEKNLASWDSFTIRELLTHTAGLIRDVRQSSYYSPENYQPLLSAIVQDMATNFNVFLSSKPKEAYYSNFGYLLLAHLVERVSKKSFHDFLNNEILRPLNMASTGQFHRMFTIPFMADGYNYSNGSRKLFKRCCRDATSFVGSHSMYSDVPDLMLWMDNLESDNPKALSKDSIDMMKAAQVGVHGSESRNYGFGLFVDRVNGAKRVWHDGMEYGYLSLVSSLPSLGVKIIILGNRHTAEVNFGVLYTQKMNDEISNLITQSLK